MKYDSLSTLMSPVDVGSSLAGLEHCRDVPLFPIISGRERSANRLTLATPKPTYTLSFFAQSTLRHPLWFGSLTIVVQRTRLKSELVSTFSSFRFPELSQPI